MYMTFSFIFSKISVCQIDPIYIKVKTCINVLNFNTTFLINGNIMMVLLFDVCDRIR
jgi:hypothetical protein